MPLSIKKKFCFLTETVLLKAIHSMCFIILFCFTHCEECLSCQSDEQKHRENQLLGNLIKLS